MQCDWLSAVGFTDDIAPSFALNRIFFSANSVNENGTVKQNNQSDSEANESQCSKMKDKKEIV